MLMHLNLEYNLCTKVSFIKDANHVFALFHLSSNEFAQKYISYYIIVRIRHRHIRKLHETICKVNYRIMMMMFSMCVLYVFIPWFPICIYL